MKLVKSILLCLCILAVVTGCGPKGDKNTVRFNVEQEPKSMDPQIMTDISAMEAGGSIWEGLTRTGKDGLPIPGVAEKWSVKGNIWTFTLRANAKWSDGSPVTAEDFFLGVKRAIDPATAAEYAYMMFHIKNAEAFNSKKITNFSKVGVKVIDSRTISFELEKPTAFFASLLSFPTYFPIPSKFFESHKANYALEADKALYNGPWKMVKWIHADRMELVKNETYWNKDAIKIEKLNYLMTKDFNTAVNMYKNEQLDMTALSGDKISEFKGSKELGGYEEGTIAYFEFNLKNKFFSNKKIRTAFASSINRETLVDKVTIDGSAAAYYFVPAVIPGVAKSFRAEYGSKIFNPVSAEEAKKLFDEGLKEIGHKGPVVITFITGNDDRTLKIAQFLQEQLRKTLGIELKHEAMTFQIRLQKMTSKDFEFLFALWGADYMDPMTYMDLWVTNGGNNHTSWSNAAYDEAIKTAQLSPDNKVRMDSMAKAEKILMDELPIAPLFSRYKPYVVKSRLKDVIKRPFAQNTDFYWAYID